MPWPPTGPACSRDLFYVENWSVTFDMVIVLRTAEQLITRLVAIVFSRRADTVAAPDQNRSSHAERNWTYAVT